MATADKDQQTLLQRCADEAIYAFGTAWIFERRARVQRIKVRILAFLGIGIPVLLGATAATFGLQHPLLPWIAGFTGILAIVQALLSVWSLVAKWDDGLAYALESLSANMRLSRAYRRLIDSARDSPERLSTAFKILEAENEQRRGADLQQGISEEEKRAGLRAGLRQYQRACAECDEVPGSMKPTKCPVCGNFPRRYAK